jgi:hypothetical protein
MDMRVKPVNVDAIDAEDTFTVEAAWGKATHVIISAEYYEHLIRCRVAHPKWDDPGKTMIHIGYSTQCPDCGFVQTGFDTEEEAAAWTCDECQPSLPIPGLEAMFSNGSESGSTT